MGTTTVLLGEGKAKSPGTEFLVVDSYTTLMNKRILGLSNSGIGSHTNFMQGLKKNGLISEIAFSFLKNPNTVKKSILRILKEKMSIDNRRRR